ncbi:hypothetical protein DL93DRAFT_2067875 [Clavulina sp. PMI_390]|nr:hypothetical protein DL93DRAFT_2067875 [Clavulina sp. PMI_390]
MPHYDDYSDSDDSDVEETQTTVLLGLPDGPISTAGDLSKPRISRIGGTPVYPIGVPTPSLSVSTCDTCQNPMELLVQLWCPLESSAFDRTLHVWGCSRPGCQRKQGSVKSMRALRYNAKYAAKLEARRQIQAAKKAAVPKAKSTVNPFSTSAASSGPQLFGGGFGDDETPNDDAWGAQAEGDAESSGDPSSASEGEDEGEDEEEESAPAPPTSTSDEVSALAASLEETTISSKPSAPSHPPLYLDTVFEYITPVVTNDAASKFAKKTASQSQDGGDNPWGVEGYEKMQGIDEVFERFVARVENEPQQCLRYDLRGTPLPFATESTYKHLFPLESSVPAAPGTRVAVTGGKESISAAQPNSSNDAGRRVYDPRTIPVCDACGSNRVFECQLMPNLINVIRQARRAGAADSNKKNKNKQTDEERRAEVARILKGEVDPADGGESGGLLGDMEWGTAMVFSCEKDCCRVKGADGVWVEAKQGWKDEYVLIQWDV